MFISGPVRLDHADIRDPLPGPVRDAAHGAAEQVSRYPARDRELRDAFADMVGVDPGMVRFTNGLEEAIELCVRAWPGTGVLPTPTFAQFARAAERTGNHAVERPMLDDGYAARFDAQALDQDIVWLCRPNNPTGTVTPLDRVAEIVADASGTVVVDEAYIDYADATSAIRLLPDREDLVVLRGFSKGFGLAGLRIGAIVAAPGTIDRIDRLLRPFTVNRIAQAAALAAVRHRDRFEPLWERILDRGRAFAGAVERLGWTSWPVNGNFVLVEFPDEDAARRTHGALRAADIHATPGWDATMEFAGLPDRFVRFTVGTVQELAAALDVLQDASPVETDVTERFLNSAGETDL